VNRISSANYICRIGLHVKGEFLEIQIETWPRALLAFIAIPLASNSCSALGS
jgi:hypothetical protein